MIKLNEKQFPFFLPLSLDACLPVGRGEGRVRVIEKILFPLPFTLFDKFFKGPCSPTEVLSKRVNPLPPVVATRNRGEGRFFGVIF